MQVPMEITFRNVVRTLPVETLIREKAGILERECSYLTSCHVVVEKPQEHQRSGNPFRVRIDVHVPPGHTVVVKRSSSNGDMHTPLTTVIRDAFKALRRQLRSLTELQRRDVKTHPAQAVSGFVTKLFPEEGYGFFETLEGHEIYFHKNSVLHHAFTRLEIGTGIRFVSELGDKGERATTMEIVEPVKKL